MHHRLQSGMRENPASDRRHGSREALHDLFDENYGKKENGAHLEPTAAVNDSVAIRVASHAAPPHAATAAKREQAQSLAQTTTRRSLPRSSGHVFEPLLASPDAAKLLGNIHVKTLQRYARSGNLPGYQIGGHWYFRASELDSWLRSRINSSCHPCRLPKEAK